MSVFKQISSYILILCLFIQYISSQNISLEESEYVLFNQSMVEFNNTKNQFDDMSNKMKNINYNIILKIRYKDLERCYKTVETKFGEIQKELNETNYEKEKVRNNIKLLDNDIHTFEIKYKATRSLYFKYEMTKAYLLYFLKMLFICLFVAVIIIMAIIGIVSFFVVRNQRRYYKLQEEYSINTDQKELNKESNGNNDDINTMSKEEQTDSRNAKIKVISSNNPSSQDEMKKDLNK